MKFSGQCFYMNTNIKGDFQICISITSHYCSRDVINFDFLDKGLEIVSSPHFVCEFSTKIPLVLYSINWPNFIAWLPLFLEILGNMFIAIVCYPGCDVTDFEINLIFLIEPLLSTWRKRHDKSLNILRTKRAFKVK